MVLNYLGGSYTTVLVCRDDWRGEKDPVYGLVEDWLIRQAVPLSFYARIIS